MIIRYSRVCATAEEIVYLSVEEVWELLGRKIEWEGNPRCLPVAAFLYMLVTNVNGTQRYKGATKTGDVNMDLN